MNRRTLERHLQRLDGFADPRVEFEQYPTPADLAAHLVHLAALQGDLDRPVVDLGSGTGVLALGACLAGARTVVGVERDAAALDTARANAARLDLPHDRLPDWVRGDATRLPLCVDGATRPDGTTRSDDTTQSDGTAQADGVTVLSNPPFGAQRGNEHADRAFLASAAEVATVSYSIHNDDSRAFVESFAADRGGEVTHAFAAEFDVDRQFAFHTDDRRTLQTELFRVEW
ncbi:METTL5 family protein [Halomarina salina]|uniref:METTL5 family protein n=1 Tax=Halomarina salina TaxID=1872699 RepID=A0ABD5RGT2_9EURY|nr:METTL5 family protein [Halomarina salina]